MPPVPSVRAYGCRLGMEMVCSRRTVRSSYGLLSLCPLLSKAVPQHEVGLYSCSQCQFGRRVSDTHTFPATPVCCMSLSLRPRAGASNNTLCVACCPFSATHHIHHGKQLLRQAPCESESGIEVEAEVVLLTTNCCHMPATNSRVTCIKCHTNPTPTLPGLRAAWRWRTRLC